VDLVAEDLAAAAHATSPTAELEDTKEEGTGKKEGCVCPFKVINLSFGEEEEDRKLRPEEVGGSLAPEEESSRSREIKKQRV
jgi:hypothetical protein